MDRVFEVSNSNRENRIKEREKEEKEKQIIEIKKREDEKKNNDFFNSIYRCYICSNDIFTFYQKNHDNEKEIICTNCYQLSFIPLNTDHKQKCSRCKDIYYHRYFENNNNMCMECHNRDSRINQENEREIKKREIKKRENEFINNNINYVCGQCSNDIFSVLRMSNDTKTIQCIFCLCATEISKSINHKQRCMRCNCTYYHNHNSINSNRCSYCYNYEINETKKIFKNRNIESITTEICLNKIIKCPICRVDNNVNINQKPIKGLEEECVICLDHKVEMFQPECGHVCMCQNCFNNYKENNI